LAAGSPPGECDLCDLTTGVLPGPDLVRPLSTLLLMLTGLTALVGLVTTVWEVAGVLAPLVLAVTAATMMSLGLGLGLWPLSPLLVLVLDTGVFCLAALRRDSRSGGRLLRGPEIIGSSRRGGDGPGAMSGELRDSGTGLSLDWILVKPGSTALLLLTSLSEMSCTSSWSLSDLMPLSVLPLLLNNVLGLAGD